MKIFRVVWTDLTHPYHNSPHIYQLTSEKYPQNETSMDGYKIKGENCQWWGMREKLNIGLEPFVASFHRTCSQQFNLKFLHQIVPHSHLWFSNKNRKTLDEWENQYLHRNAEWCDDGEHFSLLWNFSDSMWSYFLQVMLINLESCLPARPLNADCFIRMCLRLMNTMAANESIMSTRIEPSRIMNHGWVRKSSAWLLSSGKRYVNEVSSFFVIGSSLKMAGWL